MCTPQEEKIQERIDGEPAGRFHGRRHQADADIAQAEARCRRDQQGGDGDRPEPRQPVQRVRQGCGFFPVHHIGNDEAGHDEEHHHRIVAGPWQGVGRDKDRPGVKSHHQHGSKKADQIEIARQRRRHHAAAG
jgi:hypothetical protein